MRHMPGTDNPIVYIGSLKDANNNNLLVNSSIKVVFNVCNDIESKRYDGIVYTKWGLDDPKETLAERNNVESAATVLQMVYHQAKIVEGNLLVHCAAGHNRSSLTVALWAYLYHDWDFKDAVKAAQVKDKKPWMIDKGYIW